MDDKKLFNDVVFNIWKNKDLFDQVVFSMNKAYDIFMDEVPTFKKMDVKTKYHICLTAILIATDSMINQVQAITIIRKKTIEEKQYSLYYREEDKPDIIKISLQERKLLQNK